jgi:hypothetical protein
MDLGWMELVCSPLYLFICLLMSRLSSQRCHNLREFLFSPLVPKLIRFVQGNLIYLALITERVPIVGPFTPSHIIGAGEILFSEVFDINYLSERIRMPVLEWSKVKNYSSPEIEDIGCWSIWQAVKTPQVASLRDQCYVPTRPW